MAKTCLLCVLSLLLAPPAQAACDANNRFNFSFSNQPVTNLNYASAYNYSATNALAQSVNVNIAFTTNGLTSNVVGGNALPRIGNDIDNDGGASNTLVIGGTLSGRTASIAGGTRVIVVTFTFATPVRDATIALSNLDYALLTHRDWIMASGTSSAGSYVPAIVTPFGQANNTGPFANGASTLTLGPTTTPFTVTASQAAGTSNSAATSPAGDLSISFAQPVTSIELRYGNYPLQLLELLTGAQLLGIRSISFCPLPVIGVSKASAPYVTAAGDPARFAAPGADVLYAITVTNTGGSPVDLSSMLLADALPPQMIFYNGDIDDGGPLTGNFEFTGGSSGLSLAPGNLAYSNNGGTTYAYAPSAGYDPAVNALRIGPVGTMAANSSFTIRFRARVN